MTCEELDFVFVVRWQYINTESIVLSSNSNVHRENTDIEDIA